jgi:hypothetical protein
MLSRLTMFSDDRVQERQPGSVRRSITRMITPPPLAISFADINIGSWDDTRELLFDSSGNARFTNDLAEFLTEAQELDPSARAYGADAFYVCRRPPDRPSSAKPRQG